MRSGVIYQRDAVEWLRAIPSGSVDLIITDPAYESLEKHRARGTTTRLKVSKGSSNVWFPIFPNARFPELFAEMYRVLKPDAHCYIFCDSETAFIIKPMGEAASFKFWKPLIWDKRTIGMGYHYRARYELILFFEKGKRRLRDLGIADIFQSPRIRGGFPTEKPVDVSEVLIGQSSEPGDLVIDPFVGSGSVGRAALNLDRRFAGCDIDERAVNYAAVRLGFEQILDPRRDDGSEGASNHLGGGGSGSPPGERRQAQATETQPVHRDDPAESTRRGALVKAEAVTAGETAPEGSAS